MCSARRIRLPTAIGHIVHIGRMSFIPPTLLKEGKVCQASWLQDNQGTHSNSSVWVYRPQKLRGLHPAPHIAQSERLCLKGLFGSYHCRLQQCHDNYLNRKNMTEEVNCPTSLDCQKAYTPSRRCFTTHLSRFSCFASLFEDLYISNEEDELMQRLASVIVIPSTMDVKSYSTSFLTEEGFNPFPMPAHTWTRLPRGLALLLFQQDEAIPPPHATDYCPWTS